MTTDDDRHPTPALPPNWSTTSRPEQTVFQRCDIDHYIVVGPGTDEWLVLLCAQGDRAYPAPLGVRRLAIKADPTPVVTELIAVSNDLVEPPADDDTVESSTK